jgi:hypothetical protein
MWLITIFIKLFYEIISKIKEISIIFYLFLILQQTLLHLTVHFFQLSLFLWLLKFPLRFLNFETHQIYLPFATISVKFVKLAFACMN